MTDEEIMQRLKEISDMLCYELGLDAVQILAVSQDESEVYKEFKGGSGLYCARVELARSFVLDHEVKKI